MTRARPVTLFKSLLAIGAALALLVLALTPLLAAAGGPVTRLALPGPEPRRPAGQGSELEIVKSVRTDTDPTGGAAIQNGDHVTYTITIRNVSGASIQIDQVRDELTPDTFFGVHCVDLGPPDTNCRLETTPITVSLPSTRPGVIVGETVISLTQAVIWENFSLADNQVATLQFTATVDCQPVGAVIKNYAGVSYGASYLPSNETSTQVQLQSTLHEAWGKPIFGGPSGCTPDVGTYDQDWGDYDQDGDLDLALATTNQTVVYRNDNGQLVQAGYHAHRTYGVRWADVDGDGRLELISVGDSTTTAKGFKRGLNYIYQDAFFYDTADTFTTSNVLWRVDVADYDRDGDLDLAAASFIDPADRTKHTPCLLRLYKNGGSGDFTPEECLIGPLTKESTWTPAVTRRSYAVAWADIDRDGNLDLGIGDSDTHNRAHAGNGFQLGPASSDIEDTTLSPQNTTSLAWTDFDADGDPDPAWGNDGQGARLYRNNGGSPLSAITWTLAWEGPAGDATRSVAWQQAGQALALGNYGQPNRVYTSTGGALAARWDSNDSYNTTSVAWVDYDGDGDLDLTAGNYQQEIVIYEAAGSSLELNPAALTPQTDTTRSIAWADFDGDNDPDLAVGNDNGRPVQVYRQTNDLPTFMSLAWSSAATFSTQSVAWADFDGDSYPDLTVGNADAPVQLYQNDGGQMGAAPLWTSLEISNTRGLAWGDVDGDGDLDLAVANDNHRNTLYLNRLFFKIGGEIRAWGSVNDLAWADADGDGYPELAIGGVDLETPGGGFLYLIENNNGHLSFTRNGVNRIDQAAPAGLFDLAWGDYNRDGFMDLAATYPGQQEIRFYRNESGSGAWVVPLVLGGLTAYALDWVDLQRDGWPDLGVADSPGGMATPKLKVYLNRADPAGNNNFVFNDFVAPDVDLGQGIVFNLRGIDRDNDGDLDLSAATLGRQSQQFTGYGSFLNPRLANTDGTQIAAFRASSVAWGDYNGDGDLDLLYGGYGVKSQLYLNTGAAFCLAGSHPVTCPAGPDFVAGGRRVAIFGDFDGDGKLDIADGVPGGQVKLYRNGSAAAQSIDSVEAYSLAWGDGDGDGWLDLLIGGKEGFRRLNYLYFNRRVEPFLNSSSTRWTLPFTEATVSLAWADYDNDNHLDFVVGNCNSDGSHSVRLYHNDGDNTFSLATGAGLPDAGTCTRSLAWADYDGDSDPDLAVGNDNAPSFVYENQGNFSGAFAPIYTTASANTYSVAWGDWNNDGSPDLAVGNYGQPDRVYANFSAPGTPLFLWLWASSQAYKTTGLAWGDKDGDGDLDLAFSQDDSAQWNGIYENGYVSPTHLGSRYAVLPHSPTYLRIHRPETKDAYLFSSRPLKLMQTPISYTVYDPAGHSIITSPAPSLYQFEYALNGGNDWRTATLSGTTSHDGSTLPGGQPAVVTWDTEADSVVGDQVRFRLTIVHQRPVGPVQYAVTRAASPPFRVRSLTCQWPADPTITTKVNGVVTDTVALSQTILFIGGVSAGAGVMTFTWDFGAGGSIAIGQNNVPYSYTVAGVYPVTLTVVGEPCPTTRVVRTTTLITAGRIIGPLDEVVYLPMIIKGGAGATFRPDPGAPRPAPVTGLRGRMEANRTRLAWTANSPSDALLEYRVYRSPRTGPVDFQLLASTPGDVTDFTDESAACGYMYYVTAFNAGGESGASTSSYISRPCY